MTPPPEFGRRTDVIAKIQQELAHSYGEEIDQLQRELDRERDRCAMLVEETERWRNDALRCRAQVQELSTTLTNIGLMTMPAQEIFRSDFALGQLPEQQQGSNGSGNV